MAETRSEAAYADLIQVIKNNLLLRLRDSMDIDDAAEEVAQTIKAYVLAEVAETVRAMVKSHVLL